MVNGSEVLPYFFFSYVRKDYDDDEFFQKFVDDLCKTVAAEIGRDKDDVAFRDTTNIGLGGEWAPQLTHALSTCHCFVPVLTPRLINSSFCGYEWQAFQNRLDTAPPPASGKPSRLLPILWRPFDLESAPQVIKDHQYKHGAFGQSYANNGLVMLAQQKRFEDDYWDFLSKFARMMKEAVKSALLPPFEGRLDRDTIPNAFATDMERANRPVVGGQFGAPMTTPQNGVGTRQQVRVFISYSNESKDHSDRVLSFAQRLRQDGVDSIIDQFVPFPKEGWIRWMQRQLADSDFIICVCTKDYRIRFDGLQVGLRGKGANWEGQIVSQYIYDNAGDNSRFIPVIFAGNEGTDVIPTALKPYTHFVLYQQYDELYRLLTNQPAISPEPLGPVRQPPVISRGVPGTALQLDAADSIETLIRLIAAGPGKDAEGALKQLEDMALSGGDRGMAETIIRQLVSYISAVDTSSTYQPAERALRKKVMRTLIQLSEGKLNAYLSEQALSGVDLAMFDFRGADMTGVNFSGSFMIECDFREVNLRRSRFVGCHIRNARFDGASLDEVDFSYADWFNALGLTASQLAMCQTSTLLRSPATEQEMLSFLDQNYGFPFSSWAGRIQQELRQTWATYLQPGGLASEVARWAASDPLNIMCEAMRRLDEQSTRFETYPPNTPARRMFLRMTFIPIVGSSLNELECVNPVEWSDPGWAVGFSALRRDAVDKLRRVEAGLGGEPSQEVRNLLRVLKQLRGKMAEKYPQMLTGWPQR